jgi:hypothetical protein
MGSITEHHDAHLVVDAGMTCDLINLYQKRDKDDSRVVRWVTESPDLTPPSENDETAKFALLVRKAKTSDSHKSLEIHSIVVQSPLLKKALGSVLEVYPGITTNLQRLEFSTPFRPFVHRWSPLVQMLSDLQDPTAKGHFQLFYEVLHEELKDAIAVKNDLVANGVITFKYLWTIFEPGSLIYGVEDDHERIYELVSSSEQWDSRRGMAYLRLQCQGVDWDGDKFGRCNEYLSVYDFEGTRKITALAAYPFNFYPAQKSCLTSSYLEVRNSKNLPVTTTWHTKAWPQL